LARSASMARAKSAPPVSTSAGPWTMTQQRRDQSSLHSSTRSEACGFSVTLRRRRSCRVRFGLSSTAKHTGTTSGWPAASAVASRPTRASRRNARAHAGGGFFIFAVGAPSQGSGARRSANRCVWSLHQLGVLVQQRQDLLAWLRRQQEDRARDAGGGELVQDGLVGRRGEGGDADRLHVAARLGGALLEILHAGQHLFGRAAARVPAVAEVDDALQRVAALAAEEDRRVGLLRRLWPRPVRIEVDVGAVELGHVLGPDLLHRAHLLLELLEPCRELRSMVLH